MRTLEVWTDGSCWPNPGNGAWAFVLVKVDEKAKEELVIAEVSGFAEGVTNNRMEYQALLSAFAFLRSHKMDEDFDMIEVRSDSELLVKTLTEWMFRWEQNGWRRKQGKKYMPVANLDLVKQLRALREELHFNIKWVKGHSNLKYNERCDQLCRDEYTKRGLKSFEELRDMGQLKFAGGGRV